MSSTFTISFRAAGFIGFRGTVGSGSGFEGALSTTNAARAVVAGTGIAGTQAALTPTRRARPTRSPTRLSIRSGPEGVPVRAPDPSRPPLGDGLSDEERDRIADVHW